MNWSGMKSRYEPAISNLRDYLAEKHGISRSLFFFRRFDLMVLDKNPWKVGWYEVMDWMAIEHGIYVNITTSPTGETIKFDFFITFILEGQFCNTGVYNDIETYEEVFEKACREGVRVINNRLKKDTD